MNPTLFNLTKLNLTPQTKKMNLQSNLNQKAKTQNLRTKIITTKKRKYRRLIKKLVISSQI